MKNRSIVILLWTITAYSHATNCILDDGIEFPAGVKEGGECIYFGGDTEDGLFPVVKNDRYGFINRQGEIVIPFLYDDANVFTHGLAPVSKNDYTGFINEQGETIIPFIYDYATPFVHDLSLVYQDGKAGFINPDGSIAIPPKYDNAWIFSEYGVAPAAINRKWALIDRQGNPVTAFKYDYIGFTPSLGTDGFMGGFVHTGMDEITKQGISITRSGLIDYHGTEYIAPHEDIYVTFHSNLPAVRKDKTWYFLDDDIAPVTTDEVFDSKVLYFKDGMAIVEQAGKTGFVDMQINTVIPAIYDDAAMFSNGMAAVKKDGKWGYIDTMNHIHIPPRYDSAEPFSPQGYAKTGIQDKYGLIDRHGNTIITPEYDLVLGKYITPDDSEYKNSDDMSPEWILVGIRNHEAEARYHERAQAQPVEHILLSDGKTTYSRKHVEYPAPPFYHYGLFDYQGNMILPAIYDNKSLTIRDGLAVVEKDGKRGYVDTRNQTVIPLQYDRADHFYEGLAVVEQDDHCGYIDKQGTTVIALRYARCWPFKNGKATVMPYNDAIHSIDTSGNRIAE